MPRELREQLRSWPWWVEDRKAGTRAPILDHLPKDAFPFAVFGKYPPFALGSVIAALASGGNDEEARRNAGIIVRAVNAVHAPPVQIASRLAKIIVKNAGVSSTVAAGLAEMLVVEGCVLSPMGEDEHG
jgi:hypothetical protein